MSGGQEIRNIRVRDLAALLGANVALAFGPWFVRNADVGPVASAFWRMALALPVLAILSHRLGGAVKMEARHLRWLALAGVLFAADLASWHLGIGKTKLANATLLGNAASLFYPIWGFIVVRRWPNGVQALALLLAGLGAALLMGRSYQLSSDNLLGDLFCLNAGIFYTFYLIGIEKARGSLPQWTVLALSTAASILPLLFVSLVLGETVWPGNWNPLWQLALLSQIVGHGLLVLSLGRLPPLLIGIAFLTQPIIAAIVGWVAYNERLSATDWIGAVLVGFALVLVRQGPSVTSQASGGAP